MYLKGFPPLVIAILNITACVLRVYRNVLYMCVCVHLLCNKTTNTQKNHPCSLRISLGKAKQLPVNDIHTQVWAYDGICHPVPSEMCKHCQNTLSMSGVWWNISVSWGRFWNLRALWAWALDSSVGWVQELKHIPDLNPPSINHLSLSENSLRIQRICICSPTQSRFLWSDSTNTDTHTHTCGHYSIL